MFDGKVIYKKEFPIYEEEIEEISPPQLDAENTAESGEHLTYEEIVALLTKNNAYIPMPERLVSPEDFIALAVKISDEWQITLKVIQGKYRVEADFRLHWIQEPVVLKPLFVIADDYIFHTTDGLSITFVYYTHIVLCRGKLLHPDF